MSKMIRWIGGGAVGAALVASALLLEERKVSADGQPAPVTAESSAVFRRVVKKTLPAVVSIESHAKPIEMAKEEGGRRKQFDLDQVPPQMRKFFEQFDMDEFKAPQQPAGGFGSGVIVAAEGIILTNNHVVSGAHKVKVHLQDGRTFESNEIKTDPKTDLAIIRLKPQDATNLPVAELGDSDKLEIGDWVLAMGSPFGLTGTVTSGICSAKGRAPRELDVLYKDFIQTDAAINPGNSGGPIVNLDGQVVGINTAIRSSSGSFGGIGFAIPSNMVRDVLDQLIKHGKVKRGYLGIGMRETSPDLLKKLGKKAGVEVTKLFGDETPAVKAGIKEADVILNVDGTVVDSKGLQAMVTRAPIGKKLNFHVLRDGKEIDVPVTIEEQPETFGVDTLASGQGRLPAPAEKPAVGVNEKLGVEVQKHPREQALVITKVKPGSPADKAGLEPGAVLLQVENTPVASAESLEAAMKNAPLKGDGVLLKVRQGGAVVLLVAKE